MLGMRISRPSNYVQRSSLNQSLLDHTLDFIKLDSKDLLEDLLGYLKLQDLHIKKYG